MFKSLITVGVIASFAATAAVAEEKTGREEYMNACAGCHGASGKGDGPLADLLKSPPTDLTRLKAEKGEGEFPFEYVLWMVDGRNMIRFHGGEMPVWGDRFMMDAASEEAESEAPEIRELIVRGRVLSLVYYLGSIQQ
ncbi:c-type cytochrome [Marimonas lutisalis]|uniref:c-type cytochrome n=1 Tax=Marimonas lutisalis TaxID=2545756 RepID=UPI0010F5559A|nr:cytochrome c [Marimonas lutisalis]